MRVFCLLIALIAAPAIAETDLKSQLAAIRAEQIKRGGTPVAVKYMLDDLTDAAAHLSPCGRGLSQADLAGIANRIAEWRNPGFMAWATGKRSKDAAEMTQLHDLEFATARLSGCERGPAMTVRLAIQTRLRREIDAALSKPIE